MSVVVFLCLAPTTATAGESRALRILFVGNSLTYQNDLPHLFAGLAKSRGHDVQVDSYAPGGYRLAQHATDPRLLEKIDGGGWDVVVLQAGGADGTGARATTSVARRLCCRRTPRSLPCALCETNRPKAWRGKESVGDRTRHAEARGSPS
jgi:hypothetical protein